MSASLLVLLALFPSFAHAAAPGSLRELAAFVVTMTNTVVTPIVFAVAFVLVVYGLVQFFFLKGPDPEARKEGLDLALWGLVAFMFMLTFFGLVNLFVAVIEGREVVPIGTQVTTPP